jgi:hypothetical protein
MDIYRDEYETTFFLNAFKSSAYFPLLAVGFFRATNPPVSRSGSRLNVTSRRDPIKSQHAL